MASLAGPPLGVMANPLQRQLLLDVLNNNPQSDSPFDRDDIELEDEELEILLDFRHYHVPELEDEGFVDYDREQNVIRKGPHFDEVKPLLNLIDAHRGELPDDWLSSSARVQNQTFLSFEEATYNEPTMVISEAMENFIDRDISEMPPLQNSVDVDSLNSLFSADRRARDEDLSLKFTHAETNVLIDTDGVMVRHQNET